MSADAYRTADERPVEVPGFGMIGVPSFTLAPFGGREPPCPCCTRSAPEPGLICNGKRAWWSGRQLCPSDHPHFHPKCVGCGHVWLMAPRASLPSSEVKK